MRTFNSPVRHLLVCAGAAAVLFGCQNDRSSSPVGPPADGPSGYIAPIRFDQIDPYDTHFSMEATAENSTSVSLVEPVYDAATGQLTYTLTFTAPNENLYLESGYDPYNRVRLNHYRASDGVNPETGITEESRTLKITGSSFTQYDAAGSPISVEFPGDAVTFSPLTEIGSLQNVSITSGVIIDEKAVDPNAPRPASVEAAEDDPLAYENGAHKVDRSPDQLVITTFFPEPGADGPATLSAQATSGAPNGSGKMVRSFRKQGNKYVLEEVNLTSDIKTNEGSFHTRSGLQIRKVKWYENKEKDKERKEKRTKERASVPRAPDPFAPGSPPSPSALEPNYICPVSTGEIRPLVCEPPPNDPNPPPPSNSTGQNIVFQHGLAAGGSTWNRMDPWLSSEFVFGTKLIPSLSSLSSLSSQATDLKSRVDGTGKSSFLLVGHSQGGLISREVAHRYVAAGQGSKVKGVITIGTPHVGANLARNTKSAVDGALRNQASRLFGSCVSKYMSVSCWIGDQITGKVIGVATQYALDQSAPAASDLRPGSAFLNQLNAPYEPFTRVGIQSYSKKRFVWMRLAGDLVANPEDTFGGRGLAKYTQWAYDGFWGCGVVSIFVLRPGWASWCISRARALDDTDRFWDRLTAPGDRTDGIVQGSSQLYPNATRQYPISKGDSHLGENKSDLTRGVLRTTLDTEFRVPRRY